MHNAKWYKVCYVLCNAQKVERTRESQQRVNYMDVALYHVNQRLRSSFGSHCSTDTNERPRPACCFVVIQKGTFTKRRHCHLIPESEIWHMFQDISLHKVDYKVCLNSISIARYFLQYD